MGRLITLIIFTTIIIGAIITFKVPLSWIGNLPGDFTFYWHHRSYLIPLTSGALVSLFLSIFLFLFAGR